MWVFELSFKCYSGFCYYMYVLLSYYIKREILVYLFVYFFYLKNGSTDFDETHINHL